MQIKTVKGTPFSWSFLLPKYWLTWLSVGLLYSVSLLPYFIQWRLGKGIGWVLSKLAAKRVAVAKRNIELCFPDLTDDQRKRMLNANIHHAGMAVLETSMGWWWPDWRVKANIADIEGYELIDAIQAKGKGVLALAIHNMSLELACRIAGLKQPSVAFYRKHNNPLMEYLQHRGRARSNKYLIHKRDVRGMIRALNDGEVSFYLPDQDYGRTRSEFVPFFNVPEVATTKGTLLFAREANCETVFVVPMWTPDGYKIIIQPGLENFPSGDDKQDVAKINQRIEQAVMLAPEQYLWMHKRFKTRPNEQDPSLYD